MWCHNDKNDFASNTCGQISPDMPVGKSIMKYIKENDFKTILDIGTWNGLGSTRCFLLALQGNNTTQFISLETNKDKNETAKKNLANLLTNNTNLLWGSILKSEEITNIEEIFPEFTNNSEFKRWHSIDVLNIDNSPYIMDKIPNELDFVLFDGGEFTTYYEFKKIFPRCKQFIALDDVNVSKCAKIRDFLKNQPNWKEIEYMNERNGFSLFRYESI